MKIIDAHLHLFPPDERTNAMAQGVGHINSVDHLRDVYGELEMVHGVVMGNRSLDPAYHAYPADLFHYCIGLDSSLLEETEGLTGSEFSSPLLGRIFDLLRSRAAEGLSTQLPALAGALEPEEMAHLAWVAEQPENLANSRRALADYIALIREEGLRRSGTDEEALLRAAQKRYQETKAYMEEKP